MMNAYEKVEAMRKKFPDTNTAGLIKKVGIVSSQYYKARAKLQPAKAKPKRKYTKIKVEPARQDGRLMVVVGTPAQVVEALGGLL